MAMCDTGKDGYGTMHSALTAAQHYANTRGVRLRVYRCDVCRRLHLTSKTSANRWHVMPSQEARV